MFQTLGYLYYTVAYPLQIILSSLHLLKCLASNSIFIVTFGLGLALAMIGYAIDEIDVTSIENRQNEIRQFPSMEQINPGVIDLDPGIGSMTSFIEQELETDSNSSVG